MSILNLSNQCNVKQTSCLIAAFGFKPNSNLLFANCQHIHQWVFHIHKCLFVPFTNNIFSHKQRVVDMDFEAAFAQIAHQ